MSLVGGMGGEWRYRRNVDDANSKVRYISHLHRVLNCGKVENALFGVSDSILLTCQCCSLLM